MNVKLSSEQTSQSGLAYQPHEYFETLYNRYVGKVYQQCLAMTKDSELAQDFTHDIFLKVFHKLDGFQQRSSVSTWIYAVAYNYCADQLRIAKRFPVSPLETYLIDELTETEQDNIYEETVQHMNRVLNMLPEADRQLLALKYEQGKRVEQIAHLSGLKVDAVKMRLRRSRQRVERLYRQHATQ
jgi:RNA polymerase sigma-70 factor (ECF subfamily)